jgi:hypothetical protein
VITLFILPWKNVPCSSLFSIWHLIWGLQTVQRNLYLKSFSSIIHQKTCFYFFWKSKLRMSRVLKKKTTQLHLDIWSQISFFIYHTVVVTQVLTWIDLFCQRAAFWFCVRRSLLPFLCIPSCAKFKWVRHMYTFSPFLYIFPLLEITIWDGNVSITQSIKQWDTNLVITKHISHSLKKPHWNRLEKLTTLNRNES